VVNTSVSSAVGCKVKYVIQNMRKGMRWANAETKGDNKTSGVEPEMRVMGAVVVSWIIQCDEAAEKGVILKKRLHEQSSWRVR
jgi:hypothetical protein